MDLREYRVIQVADLIDKSKGSCFSALANTNLCLNNLSIRVCDGNVFKYAQWAMRLPNLFSDLGCYKAYSVV